MKKNGGKKSRGTIPLKGGFKESLHNFRNVSQWRVLELLKQGKFKLGNCLKIKKSHYCVLVESQQTPNLVLEKMKGQTINCSRR